MLLVLYFDIDGDSKLLNYPREPKTQTRHDSKQSFATYCLYQTGSRLGSLCGSPQS